MSFNKSTEFEYGPLSKLMVQDAIIIIAIYAAQVDLSNSEEKIKRIEGVAERFPVCVCKEEGIFSRINLFVNEMRVVEREKALKIAIEVLTPELRKTAFDMAAQVLVKGNTLSDQKTKILKELVTKLSIEAQFAASVIERLTNPKKNAVKSN